MPLFTSQFEYSVDDKGRLSVPARHRDQMEQEQQAPVLFVTQIRPDCLHAYPTHEYKLLIETLSGSSDESSRDALRQTTANTIECPFDKQGRVMLPKHLLAKVGIKRDVMLVGVAQHIQVWDRSRFKAWAAEQDQRQSDRPSAPKAPAGLV